MRGDVPWSGAAGEALSGAPGLLALPQKERRGSFSYKRYWWVLCSGPVPGSESAASAKGCLSFLVSLSKEGRRIL